MNTVSRLLLRTTIFLGLTTGGVAVHAAGVPANTSITNTVTVDYVMGGVTGSAGDSVSIVVEEVLDVAVAWQDAANVTVLSPSGGRVLRFRLTNLGNGSESFDLSVDETVGGDDFDPVSGSIEIWIDNGDGSFSAVDDTQYNGTNGPVLNGGDPGNDSVDVYVVADMPAGLSMSALSRVNIVAVSETAAAAGEAGNPGAEIAGGGDGGVRANVGAGGAIASVDGFYEVGNAGVSIAKSVQVVDPDGGGNPVTGATLRYSLQVNVDGSAPVDNLVISDPIPDNTRYTPGSIVLDSVAQTDADDAPATDFSDFNVSNPDAITVDLSRGGTLSITPPAVFNITFEVIIE